MTTPQAQPGQLIDIGTVAASNIAKAIGAAETAVPAIRNAIRDEIQAMSSHFTLVIADVQTGYEAELAKIKAGSDAVLADIKSDFNWLKANKVKVVATVVVLVSVGFFVGKWIA